MKRRQLWPWAGALALVLVVAPAADAWAVAPAVLPVVQALAVILPQVLALLAGAAVAALKPATYRALFRYCWTHKLFTAGFAAAVFLSVWGCREYRARFGGGVIAIEQVGAPWPALRGGPERTGAVPNANGPKWAAKVAWKSPVDNFERVDSVPAVIGNRVYFSSGTLSIYSKNTKGQLYCYDTKTGGRVWKWTGQGLLGGGLKGLYSSPVVGGAFIGLPKRPDGSYEQGKYLVVGEGYHTDFNSRVLCLDLEPVRTGKSKEPVVLWEKQTTCHVESSPCIFGEPGKERVVIGCADDGQWCMDLATGAVLWHIEGTPAYYLETGPKTDELEKLAGKYVAVAGEVDRQDATVELAGWVLLKNVTGVEELAGPDMARACQDLGRIAGDAKDKFRRTVVGKVAVSAKAPEHPKGASRVQIVPDAVTIDCESSPVAVTLPELKPDDEQAKRLAERKVANLDRRNRVFYGCGVDGGTGATGHELICADADTGKVLWRTGDMKHPVFAPPTVAGDRVIVGLGEGDVINNQGPGVMGEVHCFSAWDGTEFWKVKATATILGAVAVKDGLAYAASCDRSLYVIDVAKGDLVGKFLADAPIIGGPAVTNESVYLGTMSGRVFCMDRKSKAKRWSLNLGANQGICSSPVVAEGRVFVGTVDRGFFALVEDTAQRPPRPWTTAGGGIARDGAADDQGLPAVSGKFGLIKWVGEDKAPVYPLRDRTMEGPTAACGTALYLMLKSGQEGDDKPYLARVNLVNGEEVWRQDLAGPASALVADGSRVFALVGPKGEPQRLVCRKAADGTPEWDSPPTLAGGVLALGNGRILVAPKTGGLACLTDNGRLTSGGSNALWTREIGEVTGSPAAAWGLAVVAVAGSSPKVLCLDQADGGELWSAALPGEPSGAPAVAGGRVYVACALAEPGKGRMVCRRLADGGEVWSKELPETPVHYPVAGDEVVAVATLGGEEGKQGKVFALAAADGKLLRDEGFLVGEGVQPPALVQGTLVCAARNKIPTWSPATSDWPWAFKDQGVVGRPLAPPIVARETVYVITERKGLVAIAPAPPPEITRTAPADGEELKNPRPRLEVSYRDEVNPIDPASLQIELLREMEAKDKGAEAKPDVLVSRGAYTFNCPELGIAKDTAAGATKGRTTTVVFTSSAPLAPGVYKVTVTVSNRAGVRAFKSWGFTVKEGGK